MSQDHIDYEKVKAYYRTCRRNNSKHKNEEIDRVKSRIGDVFSFITKEKDGLIGGIRNLPTGRATNVDSQVSQIKGRLLLYFALGIVFQILNIDGFIMNGYSMVSYVQVLISKVTGPSILKALFPSIFLYLAKKTQLEYDRNEGSRVMYDNTDPEAARLVEETVDSFKEAIDDFVRTGRWNHSIFDLSDKRVGRRSVSRAAICCRSMAWGGSRAWDTWFEKIATRWDDLQPVEQTVLREARNHVPMHAPTQRLGKKMFRMSAKGGILEVYCALFCLSAGNVGNAEWIVDMATHPRSTYASFLKTISGRFPPDGVSKEFDSACFVTKRTKDMTCFRWDKETKQKYVYQFFGNTAESFQAEGKYAMISYLDACLLDYYKGQDYTEEQAQADFDNNTSVNADRLLVNSGSLLGRIRESVFAFGNIWADLYSNATSPASETVLHGVSSDCSPEEAFDICKRYQGSHTVSSLDTLVNDLEHLEPAGGPSIDPCDILSTYYESPFGLGLGEMDEGEIPQSMIGNPEQPEEQERRQPIPAARVLGIPVIEDKPVDTVDKPESIMNSETWDKYDLFKEDYPNITKKDLRKDTVLAGVYITDLDRRYAPIKAIARAKIDKYVEGYSEYCWWDNGNITLPLYHGTTSCWDEVIVIDTWDCESRNIIDEKKVPALTKIIIEGMNKDYHANVSEGEATMCAKALIGKKVTEVKADTITFLSKKENRTKWFNDLVLKKMKRIMDKGWGKWMCKYKELYKGEITKGFSLKLKASKPSGVNNLSGIDVALVSLLSSGEFFPACHLMENVSNDCDWKKFFIPPGVKIEGVGKQKLFQPGLQGKPDKMDTEVIREMGLAMSNEMETERLSDSVKSWYSAGQPASEEFRYVRQKWTEFEFDVFTEYPDLIQKDVASLPTETEL